MPPSTHAVAVIDVPELQLAVATPPESVDAAVQNAASVDDVVGALDAWRRRREQAFANSVEAALECSMGQLAGEAHAKLYNLVRGAFCDERSAATQRLADALAEKDRLHSAYVKASRRVEAAQRAEDFAFATCNDAAEVLGPEPVVTGLLTGDPVAGVCELVADANADRDRVVSALAQALRQARNGQACLTAKVARARATLRFGKVAQLQAELNEAHRQVAVLTDALVAAGGPAALADVDAVPLLSARSVSTNSSFESIDYRD